MVPPRIRDSAPLGEKSFFKLLQSARYTEDWIAMHSLHLANHVSKQEAEIDMVLIIPNEGILCLEIKGVGVSRENGVWKYEDGRSHPEGPFSQASSAMHSLRGQLSAKNPDFSKLLYFSAVIFSGVKFSIPQQPTEWHRWQVVDEQSLRTRDISSIFKGIITRAHDHMNKYSKSWYDPDSSRPSDRLCEQLKEALRPNFRLQEDKRLAVRYISQEIKELTQEQNSVLTALSDNPRIIASGPAGTGKTVLAVEAFKRSVLAGKRTALLCFNRLLGSHLQQELESFILENEAADSAVISTFHSFMLQICQNPRVPAESTNQFFSDELPKSAIDKLLDAQNQTASNEFCFDHLVIDEGQDLLTPLYLDCMDLLLTSGFEKSEWTIFGDFENQNIFDGDFSFLTQRVPAYSKFLLKKNCRNAGQIAEAINLLFNVQPAYEQTLDYMDGASADPIFWRNESTQLEIFHNTIDKYLNYFKPSEIVVLSKTRMCSVITSMNKGSNRYIAPYGSQDPRHRNLIRHSTIAAFKGLESPAVLVTDITDLDDAWRLLLYVAVSRARISVTMLMSESCRPDYQKLVDRGFLK